MEYYTKKFSIKQHQKRIFHTKCVVIFSTLFPKDGVLIMIIVSEKIKQLRIQKGLTQSQLSSLLGCSSSTISGYELGTKRPDYENLVALARIFNVSTDYLLGVENKREMLDTSSLTNEEIQVLQNLIKLLRKK